MTNEILPCPFCGSPAVDHIENNGAGCFWVICDNVKSGCGCEGPYQSSPDQAIAAWNRRALSQSNPSPLPVDGERHGIVSTDLMQRVWANLYYDEEAAGNTFQGTLNDVVDWLAAHNSMAAIPAGTVAQEPVAVTDLWFTDRKLPLMAISGDAESDRTLKLHFRRKVTNADRDDLVAAINASLVEPQEPVAVKALEWVETTEETGRYASAKTRVGGYDVFEISLYVRGERRTTFGWTGHWLNGDQKAESFAEAKAAAQSDYETRIRSAIVGGAE